MKNFKEYLGCKRQEVETCLASLLPEDGPLAAHYEAMRYSLLAGGKRVRPILAIATAEIFRCETTPFMPVICSLECIHTYSLIHDDLPAMDDDDLRRGKPTNHKVFGEAEAILAGDGLLTLAFELLSRDTFPSSINHRDILKIIHIISRAAGSSGMVGGQCLDIKAEGKNVSLEDLQRIHRLKTGALITAAVQVGAVIGNADADQFDNLTTYGKNIGLAFQMKDDLLNIEGDEKELGKAVGSDAEHNKATYPSLLGLENTKKQLQTTITTALAALDDFDEKADPLRQLAAYILNRRR